VTTRIAQLQALLAELRAGDAAAAAVAAQGPAPGDADGSFLAQLLAWRTQRQQAGEVQRLQRLVTNYNVKVALSGRARARVSAAAASGRVATSRRRR
jgi:hypothetical protein